VRCRETGSITAHEWVTESFYKLQCAVCGAGLSDEGLSFLAIELQKERDALRDAAREYISSQAGARVRLQDAERAQEYLAITKKLEDLVL